MLSVLGGTASSYAAPDRADQLRALLDRVDVVATRGYHPGYDRDCRPGGCIFGEEWTDRNTTRFGHNGCDTRQDDDGYDIQVDHVCPLTRAWHEGRLGLDATSPGCLRQRRRRELLAVTNQANQDSTPAEWMPPRRAYWCDYLVRYLRVADTYDLPITRADADPGRGRHADLTGSRGSSLTHFALRTSHNGWR